MNHVYLDLASLLLANDTYRVWGRFDNQRGGFGVTLWLIFGGAIAILLLTMLVSHLCAKHHKKEFWHDSPPRLFNELCRAQRLDSANRRLIKKLASERGATMLPRRSWNPNTSTRPTFLRALNHPPTYLGSSVTNYSSKRDWQAILNG